MIKIVSIISTGILLLSVLGAGASLIQEIPLKQTIILDEYDMVIIAPSLFSDALQLLIDHKNSIGIQTFLKTTEDIYSEYEGRDEAEQIKYCIYEYAKSLCIQYVLLIGDVDIMPIRKTEVNHIWPSSDYNWTQTDNIITDLYYADIYDLTGNFSSWDSNNDNIFSEYYLYNLGTYTSERVFVDEVDLYPDIGVGRIPCSNIDELEIVINKIITYETQTNDWFYNIILAGSDGFPEPGNQGEMITEQIAELMTGFTQIKLYESLKNLNPRSINREINNGAGFFICSTHGGPGGFHNYRKMNVIGLRNQQKLPIVFLLGCFCAALDNSIISNLDRVFRGLCFKFYDNIRLRKIFDNILQIVSNTVPQYLQSCIAWELLKCENGGSVATIGGTRSGTVVRHDPPSGFSGFFSIKFFESYEPGNTLSKMYNNAVTSFIDDSWKNLVTLQRFIILGDPSLKIGGYQ